ncbi:hypothetical protein N5079_06050 [Planotetraspora sp. A-T 1434]|uniref:hypothetical protein n=1 Tax=Planotetraspora sp. A-T 1434 TaxID=2979219 RepID=UPI0021C124AF|nr:hypothetical protein [Planotetraspora sp. A-T 1434]MCT9929781.1 hypothetical protein [Planotetraspora sp. A-T 1434]
MLQAAKKRPPVTAALRFGAILAASVPTVLYAFGVGRVRANWSCFAASYMSDVEMVSREIVLWGSLLLPVVLAGLLLYGSRWTTFMGVISICAVLLMRLVLVVGGLDHEACAREALPAVLPWSLIACYVLAAALLIMAGSSPSPGAGWRVAALWGAAVVAAWTTVDFGYVLLVDSGGISGSSADYPSSFWDGLGAWAFDAEATGLPLAVVALAMASTVLTKGWLGRLGGLLGVGFLLGFAAVGGPTGFTCYAPDCSESALSLVSWPSLLAAIFPLLAVYVRASRNGSGNSPS